MAAMSTIAIGMAVGAVVGGGAAAIQSGGNFDAIWKGALVGAAAGGIGGWAAPALAPTLGITSAAGMGALGGGIAGVSGGLLNAAVNGGTGEDYWKGALFGGLGGAATGALAGGLSSSFGGETTGINPVTGEPVPVGTPEITPLSDAGTPAVSLSSPAASGMGGSNIDAASTINSSVTGGSATPAPTSTPFDTSGIPLTQSNQYAFDDAVQSIPMGTQQSFNNAELSNLGQYIGAENANPTVNAGNTADPFSMGKAWSAPTSQVEAQLAPYAAENAAQNKLMWQGGNNSNQPGFFDSLFSKKTGGDMLGKVLMGNMMGNALKGAGSIMGMNEARQNQQQLMDLYNQQNQQYQTQNAAANAYQNQLGETYTNPDAYLSSPEAVASRQLAMQKLLAQNAMAGRRTAGLPMQNQLMMNQLANLQNYRQGLRSAATGAYASPTGMANVLQAAQAQSPQGNLMAGLGSIFAPAATYYMMG